MGRTILPSQLVLACFLAGWSALPAAGARAGEEAGTRDPEPSILDAPTPVPSTRMPGIFRWLWRSGEGPVFAPISEVPRGPAEGPAREPVPTAATRPEAGGAGPGGGGARVDLPVRRVQATPGESQPPAAIDLRNAPPIPPPSVPNEAIPSVGGQSLSLQAALYGTLTGNPDLATLRLGNPTTPSAEAVEVARHFPTTLNPTLWCDLRPITLIPPDTFVATSGRRPGGSYYHFGQFFFYLSLRQPVELGHQTTHRYHIAKAAFEQQSWTVVQAELLAMVQTYRFFQTAAYRRERLKVARQLADFNERISRTLERRLEANQVPAADVVLARVESRATRQLVKVAEQDYVTALTDLRNQVGIPESAGVAEPLGEFTLPPYIPPRQEQEFLDMALRCRPDIRAAQAAVKGTKAAENLARADRIPTPIIGPQYAMDEAGIQYIGLVYITPIPIWNTGTPLVRQREADHRRAHQALQQARQRAVSQVRAALAKWNGASDLVKETAGFTGALAVEVDRLERLFDQGQTDLGRLMQAQQRLIQLRTAEIDAIWAATQAQADLLLALGAPALIQGMLSQAEGAAASPAPAAQPSVTLPGSTPSPFRDMTTPAPPTDARPQPARP